MARCSAIKADGTRCMLQATGANGLCWSHTPGNASKRKSIAIRGGRSRPSKVIRELHAAVDDVAEKVLDGTIKPYPGMVFGQLMGVKIRLLEFERALKETEEFEERLAQLEQQASNRTNGEAGLWAAP